MNQVRVLVLADTHAPRRWKTCPPRVAGFLEHADVILHAGDVCTATVLDELNQFAPVHAVLGNNDGPDVKAWGAEETLELTLDGLTIGMIHDSGHKDGRPARMRHRFPNADLVVFGHSHIPMDMTASGILPRPPDRLSCVAGVALRRTHHIRIFNPGSPTDRRRQPHGTLGELIINDGRITEARIIPVT